METGKAAFGVSASYSYPLAELVAHAGHDFGLSAPMVIDRARVARFAACSGDGAQSKDVQPMLLLSLLSQWQLGMGVFPKDAKQIVNYGLGETAFLSPVRIGSTARAQVRISRVQEKGRGHFLVTTESHVYIDGSDGPALRAELIGYVRE